MRTKQKNILYLLHLPPPVHGSTLVGKYVKESDLLNNSFQGRYLNIILSDNVSDSGRTNLKKIVRFFTIWIQLIGKLLHRKPDLCYFALTTTGAGFYKDVLLVATLRMFRMNIIYHIHNKGVSLAAVNSINHRLYQFVFNHAKVILLSKYLYYDLQLYVPEDCIYYCANGIRDYEPVAALVNLPHKQTFNILFLSNLIEDKGVFVLLEACSLLKQKGHLFHCDFVGGEGDVSEAQFNAYVEEKGLSKEVKYWGKRYGRLKEISFEQADVFVLPSRYDCFPLVILEAMQHHLPVITAFEGGMPEMVDEGVTGYLIDRHDDVDTLVERIERLMKNPELRRQLGANGRKKFEREFTLSIFEKRLWTILKNVTEN